MILHRIFRNIIILRACIYLVHLPPTSSRWPLTVSSNTRKVYYWAYKSLKVFEFKSFVLFTCFIQSFPHLFLLVADTKVLFGSPSAHLLLLIALTFLQPTSSCWLPWLSSSTNTKTRNAVTSTAKATWRRCSWMASIWSNAKYPSWWFLLIMACCNW